MFFVGNRIDFLSSQLMVFGVLTCGALKEPLASLGIVANGLSQALVEGDNGFPPQFSSQLCAIYSVAPIVPRSVLYRCEQRLSLAHDAQDLLSQVYIRPFVVSADVVDLVYLSFVHDEVYGAAVVEDMNPVPHIETIAVDRDGLIVQSIQDDSRDELLRMLLGTIIIAAS